QEHFYDPVSHCGFIEVTLRNLRRTLQDNQRRYRKRRRSSDPSHVTITLEVVAEGEEESIKEWITITKRMRPTSWNLASIKMGMEKTFSNRRFWISSKSPTVTEIFQQYPRFVDLPYLLDAEFGKMFPGKENLLLKENLPTNSGSTRKSSQCLTHLIALLQSPPDVNPLSTTYCIMEGQRMDQMQC
ncbi:Hypothetical protein SMAX5B_022217, partial [Scophthalmus maximus]